MKNLFNALMVLTGVFVVALTIGCTTSNISDDFAELAEPETEVASLEITEPAEPVEQDSVDDSTTDVDEDSPEPTEPPPAIELANVTDDDFSEVVLNSERVVLVDFWAPWCGPCRLLSPIVKKVAADYQDKVTVVKVNVDDSKATAASYKLRSIPTLLVFKDGEVVSKSIGLKTEAQVAAMLEEALSD